MKRVMFIIVATTILAGAMANPAMAQHRDWDTLVERHAEHSAYARTWEQNYTQIYFYGGATYLEESGIQFRLTYSIRCRGGFERSRTVILLEDPESQYYRGRTVRVPRPTASEKVCVGSNCNSFESLANGCDHRYRSQVTRAVDSAT